MSRLALTRWNNGSTGFLSDYFSAPSDESAARAIETDADLREPPYDVLPMKNLIPHHDAALGAYYLDVAGNKWKPLDGARVLPNGSTASGPGWFVPLQEEEPPEE